MRLVIAVVLRSIRFQMKGRKVLGMLHTEKVPCAGLPRVVKRGSRRKKSVESIEMKGMVGKDTKGRAGGGRPLLSLSLLLRRDEQKKLWLCDMMEDKRKAMYRNRDCIRKRGQPASQSVTWLKRGACGSRCAAVRCAAVRAGKKKRVLRVCACVGLESAKVAGAETQKSSKIRLLPEQEGSVERESHTSIESSKWRIPTREEHKRVARDAQRWKRRCRLQQTDRQHNAFFPPPSQPVRRKRKGLLPLFLPNQHFIRSSPSAPIVIELPFEVTGLGDIHAQRFNLTTRVHLFSLLSPSPFGGADRSHFTQFNVTFLRVSSAFAGSRTCSSAAGSIPSLCQRERTAGDSPTPTYGPTTHAEPLISGLSTNSKIGKAVARRIGLSVHTLGKV